MKIMAINAGSSSLKFQLFNMPSETVIIKGIFERIGFETPEMIYTIDGKKTKEKVSIFNHGDAVDLLIHLLLSNHLIEDLSEIKAIGHRVAQGGSYFKSATVIDDFVVGKIEELAEFAPLHNPASVQGIQAFMGKMPDALSVAVFDTAFHQTMAPETYLYPIPYEFFQKYNIRKFGFHGTNHHYVSKEAARILNSRIENMKVISCHLGNGVSICAIDHGKSVNTSMGFTPLAGLMMGTRSGTVDPSIVPYMMEKTRTDIHGILSILNKKSGFLGISGISNDYRDVEEAAKWGHERAQLALKMFLSRIREYIGAYVAFMDGVDAIIFTGGIGENSAVVRNDILSNMTYLGVRIDKDLNNRNAISIHQPDSKVKLLVIPANEELMIAREAWCISERQTVAEFK